MKEKIHYLAAVLFFICATPSVALLADMPIIRTASHYYCDFMANYELAQKIVDEAQVVYFYRGKPCPGSISNTKQALQIWHERVCTFACWRSKACNKRCTRRDYDCGNMTLFGPRSIIDMVEPTFQRCQETYLDEILSEQKRTCESWWEFFTSPHCPDPFANLKDALARLDRELEHQCATMRDDPSVNITAFESKIAFAKQRAPNFDSVSFAKVTPVGHIACALKTIFSLHTEEESTACYERVLQSYIVKQEKLLGYARNFKQMCAFLAKSHLGNTQSSMASSQSRNSLSK